MPTPRGLAHDENATGGGEGSAKPKPKAKPAKPPARPWYWHLSPAGIANEARYRAKQIERINRGHTFTGHRFDPKYGVVIPGQWVGPNGQRSGLSPVERDIVYGAAVKPVKTVANLAINLAQRATNGWKPADPASTPVGRLVNQADRQIKGGMLIKQDEQRRPEDLFWQQMGEMASTSVVGGVAAHGLVPAAAFTTGAFKTLAPTAQQALRWTAGVGTESMISTALTDNRTGSVANAFGENAPMAVKPDDDMVSALGKSLIPNAGAEISLGLGFLGLGKAVGKGLEGFDNVARRQAEGRAADEVTNARNFTKEAGLQDEVDGEHSFTQQATEPAPAAAAPEAAPAAPPTKQQAEDELLGPKEQPAETAAAPIEEPEYSPELPEVDTAVMAAGRLDDDQLIATAQGTGPVLPELERQLAEQRAGFQPQEGLTPDVVAAPTESLAMPTVPYEDQWSQLPNQTLFSLASPANNPELFDIVSKMTGRSYEEFTWTDVVDGLKALQEQGTTVLPDRVMNGSGMSKTSELSVNAPLFQYKDNVNAQGQQKGNSLEGVTKWNPDLEQVNLVWDNPADGQTYMINGHNSLAKAKELGIPTIPTKRILANTPGEARLIGAKANIASGGGTAFDAAKIIRELGIQDAAGLEAAGIPLDSGLGTSGLALSKLPDDLFQQTINGELGMGRALALGGSGLDPADMIRVAGLGGKKEISERGFAELVQMASSAPKVADAAQGGLPGMDEWLKDSSVIEKAELSAKVRAELINSKNLFGKVGKNKAAQKLADKGGTQVNQEQVTSAADIAKAVLDEFDRDKYLANTPISELLNQGASDIAAGAKPAVIAKRILQQLETAAEAAPPVVKAEPSAAANGPERWESWPPEKQQQKAVEAQGLVLPDRVLANRQKYKADSDANAAAVERYNDENPGSNSPNELTEEQFIAKYGADESTHPQLMHKGGATPKQLKDLENHNWAQEYLAWYEQKTANAPMTPEMRKQLKAQVVKRAIENGEVRPSATPLPDLPDPPKDLNDPAALIADEARLAQEYGTQNAIADQLALDAKRQAMGWSDMSLEQKKASGMLDEWQRPQEPVGDSLEDRAAYAREQRMAAEAAGDTTLAREWQNAERRLERDRIAQSQQRQATSQSDMFGVGKYDDNTPLLNEPTPTPAAGFELPKGLAGAKPRYGYRDLNFEVSFGNDFDRAAYSLAGDAKGTSKQAAKYRQALEDAGYDLKEVVAHGQKVKAALKEQAQAWKPDPENRSVQALELPAQSFKGSNALSPLSDLDEEAAYLGLRAGPLPFMDMPTSEAVKTRRIMEDVFTDAVRRITGKEDVAFHGYTDRVIKPSEHGGDGVRTGTRNGFYDPMTDMVNVMGLMDRSPGGIVETVVHESWHRIQYTLLTLKDMEIFDSVFGKIRINDLASMRSANGKASLEKQAYAAQVVAAYKAQGLDASMEGVRIGLVEAMDDQFPLKDGRSWGNTLRGEVGIRVIQGIYKVMDLIERVNNGIRGRGFETVQSMFEKAYSGELAKTRAWDSVAQLTTPDQKARLAKLEEWRKDNRKGISEINQMVASIDEQINALKSQAMKGGC